MWRITVILGTVLSVLLFGAVVASAGWWWNAELDIEGVEVRTAWTVTDDPGANHKANIHLTLPAKADVSIVQQASNESIKIKHSKRYECSADGIEATVSYRVRPAGRDAVGTQVAVEVTADGDVVGEGTGVVGKQIKVDVFVPVDNPSCAQ
jgi:hypothetical protein